MTRKILNKSSAGSGTEFGADDVDKINQYLTGVDQGGTDPVDINTITKFRNLKLQIANAANTAKTSLRSPTFTGDGDWMLDEPYDYYVFIDVNDSNKVKAKNGKTGKIDFNHDSDAGNVLNSVFGARSANVPFYVAIGSGNFKIESWGSNLDNAGSNFTIKGRGSGVTNFVITDTLTDSTGMFSFFGPSSDTANNLSSSAPKNSFSVLSNTTTGLVVGGHCILGSSALLPLGVAETGEHNRIVKIVAGSPNRIILEKYTRFDYNTGDTAYIKNKAFMENVHLEGFTLKADQSIATYTGQKPFMRLDYAYNFFVRDVHFLDWGNMDGGFHHCLVLNMVVNSIFEDLVFEQSPERVEGADPQNPTGYAISCRAGCETVYFNNCLFMGLIRHNFTTTANTEGDKVGHPMNIWLINCNAETTTESSFESHGEGDGINYINCSMHSSRSGGDTDTTPGTEDTDAFSNRCNRVRYINCTVENCRGTPFAVNDGEGHQIIGCKAKNIYLNRNAFEIGSIGTIMSNCTADDIDGRALLINGAGRVVVTGFRSSNTNITNTTQSPVRIEGSSAGIVLSDFYVDVSNAPRAPISCDPNTNGVTISNFTTRGATGVRTFPAGTDIRIDHDTCRGAGLNIPRYKIGSFYGNHNQGDGLWVGSITTDTGGSRRIEGTDGTFREYAVSTLAAVEGFRTSNYTEEDQDPYLRFRFRLENTTGLRFYAGFSSDDTTTASGADPLANQSGFMIKLDTAVDSNIKIYHNSGDATSTTGATIEAVDTDAHTIEFRATDSDAGFQWRWDQGDWSSTITTDIPSGATDLCAKFYIENNEDTVSKTVNMLEAYTEIKNS